MSEPARQYSSNSVYTTTEGNVTRLFFGEPEQAAPAAAPRTREHRGRGNVGRSWGERVAELRAGTPAVQPKRKPDSAGQRLTHRQQELAKAEHRDMSVVPLESYAQVKEMVDYFEQRAQYREACLLVFGFCTGLRISDLLQLKVGDIVSSEDPAVFRAEIDIREQKTGKRTVSHIDSVLITDAMREYFNKYLAHQSCRGAGLDSYLFTTVQSRGRKPMSTRTIQLALAPAFAAVAPHLHCSTHTMRKTFVSIIHTFASQATMTGGGINPTTACQIALRHADAATTMAYMGTMKSGMLSLRRAVSDFVLGKTKLKNLKCEYTWETEED